MPQTAAFRLRVLCCIAVTVTILRHQAKASAAPKAWWYGDFPDSVRQGSKMVDGNGAFRIYQNFWFHAQRFYAIECLATKEPNATHIKTDMTLNMMLITMPVANAADLYQNVQATSLMFIHNDFYGSMLDEYPMPINTHQLDEAVHADRLVGRAAFDGVGVSSDFCSSTHKLNKVCMQTGWWAGNTLLIDFPFAAFPDSMGHWAEVLLPLYSVLVNGDWKQQVQGKSAHIDRLLLTNVRREELQKFEWLLAVLQISLGPGLPPGIALPVIVCYDELEGMDSIMWLGMENAIIVNDRYTHPEGRGGFASVEHGKQFREAAYKLAGLNQPAPWQLGGAPHTITLMSAVTGEMVVNRNELLGSLEDIAHALDMRVRPYSATSGAGFASYVAAMSRTGVLVARHGPLLANALFLPPGAVVLELLAYNWEWKGISEVYVNITQSVGDIHHFGWRAKHPRWSQYLDADEARYAYWTPEECSSRHCVEVHARAGMVADTSTIHEMLMDVLPAAFSGATVQDLKQPWPLAFTATGTTGLWWDK